MRETSIALTPVGDGRFEIYVDDEKVWDRTGPGSTDFYPSLRDIRKVRPKVEERFKAISATR